MVIRHAQDIQQNIHVSLHVPLDIHKLVHAYEDALLRDVGLGKRQNANVSKCVTMLSSQAKLICRYTMSVEVALRQL